MSAAPRLTEPRAARQIYCLCAEWCGVCREWRARFDALAAAHPGEEFAWIDVDEHDAVLEALDIETFPVLLIGAQGRVLFCGPVEPTAATVQRLLARLDAPAAADPGAQRALDYLASI